MLAGRTAEQKRRLVQRLTDVLCEELEAKPDAVVITLIEVPRENYARRHPQFRTALRLSEGNHTANV